MKNRFFSSLVLLTFTLVLGACAGPAKILPNGNVLVATTVGDTWDRSTTQVGEYQCPRDKEGKPIYRDGKCTLAQNAAPPDRVHGQSVAGQVAVGMMGGTGAALVNGNTARSVAEKGKCSGAGCPGGAGAGAASNNNVVITVTNGCTGATCGK